MSLSTFETPDYGRSESQSALDFTYWVLTYLNGAYGRDVIFSPNAGLAEDGENMLIAVRHGLDQVGINSNRDLGLFRTDVLRRGHNPSPTQALRTRGALLFHGDDMLLCLGDTKRVMEHREGEYIVRHLTLAERPETFWDGACLIPEMIYL